jgi:hypothetical protein
MGSNIQSRIFLGSLFSILGFSGGILLGKSLLNLSGERSGDIYLVGVIIDLSFYAQIAHIVALKKQSKVLPLLFFSSFCSGICLSIVGKFIA